MCISNVQKTKKGYAIALLVNTLKKKVWGLSSPYVCAKSLQSCLTLCNRMDCSLLGSSVHGVLQARVLEWVAISSSRRSYQALNRFLCPLHRQLGCLPPEPTGKPSSLLKNSKEIINSLAPKNFLRQVFCSRSS